MFGVRACSLRLTNVYGPRQLLKHNRQGFIAWFIRQAVEDREIQIYGDGSQLRDFVYVDDAADAFLRAGATDACNGQVFNVGGAEPISLRDLVELLIDVAGIGPIPSRRMAAGEEGHRHRRLLRRLVAHRPHARLAAAHAAARRPHADDRVLPRAPAPLRDGRVARRRAVSARAPIPFIDLRPGEDDAAVRDAIDRVIARGWFVLGPEVEAFETEFAAACGAAPCDRRRQRHRCDRAALRALDIGAGDEVIVPAMTAAYTGLAVIAAGARPVIVDVEPDTLTIDPAACAAAVTARTRAIVPVHLYGQPADMDAIRRVAARHSLAIVEDCCQAHLATEQGVAVGTRADAAAFSFYPTKNLGALGDGGAVITGERGDRRSGSPAAQRRTARARSPRRGRREQPARRAAGGGPARAAAAAGAVDGPPPRAGSAAIGARCPRTLSHNP